MPSHGTGGDPAAEKRFWDLAANVVGSNGVEEGTLMGGRCLRVHGEFLAMYYGKEDAMILKLDENRVNELVAADRGHPFAPAGKVFRAWIAIPSVIGEDWQTLLGEAISMGQP